MGLDPDIYLEVQGNCESLSRNRWSAVSDFKSGPPKYEAGLLPNDRDIRWDKEHNRFLVSVLTILRCYSVNSIGELVTAEGLETLCRLE